LRTWLPVLRDRRRYMAFELDSENKIQSGDLAREIYTSQTSLLGDFGASKTKLQLISFDGRFGIIRCTHKHIEEAKVVLTTVRAVRGTRATMRVRGISGTIKAATEKYIPQSILHIDENERRIDLEQVSGFIVRIRGQEVDIYPDDRSITKESDTKYVGLTSFDLCGGDINADGTSNGL